jgi:hypothetical protein
MVRKVTKPRRIADSCATVQDRHARRLKVIGMADRTAQTSEVTSCNPDRPPVREPSDDLPASGEMEPAAATFARIQAACIAVIAEAYLLRSEYGPDEPVPLWPTPAGEAVPCPPESQAAS